VYIEARQSLGFSSAKCDVLLGVPSVQREGDQNWSEAVWHTLWMGPRLAPKQSWVWNISDFIFLASAYEGGWPDPSLAVTSSHWQCMASVYSS